MATAPKRTPDSEAPDPSPADAAVSPASDVEAIAATTPATAESAGDRSIDQARVDADATTFTHDHPSDAEIAAEAYAIYVAGGRRHGADVDDWLEAERRLRVRRG